MAPVSSQVSERSEVSMENTEASPKRYLLRVESFSLFSDKSISKYESSEFECSGYKWKMIIYRNGDADGCDHISIYLAIVGTNSLPSDWEVNATFSFLMFDQIHDNFVVMKGMERRFRNIKAEWGFSKCISNATFKEASNGYLVNDKCVFGVDLYVIKNGVGECVTLLSDSKSYKHEWKILDFTKLKNQLYSDEFSVGGYKWKLLLYPTGLSGQNGQNISIYLESVDAKGFDCPKRVQAKYSLSVKNQISDAHRTMTSASHWFSSVGCNWGWAGFMPLSELKDPKKGFLVDDCCIMIAEVSVLGAAKGLT